MRTGASDGDADTVSGTRVGPQASAASAPSSSGRSSANAPKPTTRAATTPRMTSRTERSGRVPERGGGPRHDARQPGQHLEQRALGQASLVEAPSGGTDGLALAPRRPPGDAVAVMLTWTTRSPSPSRQPANSGHRTQARHGPGVPSEDCPRVSRRWRTSGGRAGRSPGRRCRGRGACATSPPG